MTGAAPSEPIEVELLGRTIRLDTTLVREPDQEVRRQIREYGASERTTFDLTVEYPETFAGSVWRRVAGIPYGETRTYGELAADLGTAPVAVGGANARNPVPVVVPCHRVVGTDSLRGYRYPGLERTLLRHEGSAGSLGFELDGSA